jgi:RHS repeat-associated protein
LKLNKPNFKFPKIKLDLRSGLVLSFLIFVVAAGVLVSTYKPTDNVEQKGGDTKVAVNDGSVSRRKLNVEEVSALLNNPEDLKINPDGSYELTPDQIEEISKNNYTKSIQQKIDKVGEQEYTLAIAKQVENNQEATVYTDQFQQIFVKPDQESVLTTKNFKLTIPAGSVTEPVVITYQLTGEVSGEDSKLGNNYTLTAQDILGNKVSQFSNNLKIEVFISDKETNDLKSKPTDSVKTYYFNEDKLVWEEVATTTNLEEKTVVSFTDHFTQFVTTAVDPNNSVDPSSPFYKDGICSTLPDGSEDELDADCSNFYKFKYCGGLIDDSMPEIFNDLGEYPCFSTDGLWIPQPVGVNQTSLFNQGTGQAAWTPDFKSLNGNFEVKVTLPPVNANLEIPEIIEEEQTEPAKVKYFFFSVSNGITEVEVDTTAGGIVSLGEFNFDGSEALIQLSGFEGTPKYDQFLIADAVCIGGCEGGFENLDITPPEIKNVQANTYEGKLYIEADVTDDVGVGNVYLSLDGELTTLTKGEGDRYSGSTNFASGKDLDYFIIAYDTSGNESIWNNKRGYVIRGSVQGIGVPEEIKSFINYKKSVNNRILSQQPGLNNCEITCGDPINTQNGNFLENIELANLSGRPSIDFKIFYNSLGDSLSSFGQNWNHSYNYKLIEMENADLNGVFVTYPTGQTRLFTLENGQYIPDGGLTDKLIKTENGFELTVEDNLLQVNNAIPELTDNQNKENPGQSKLTFDEYGDIKTISDLYGNSLSFEYAQQSKYTNFSKLSKVTSSSNQQIVLEYSDLGPLPEDDEESTVGQGLVNKIIINPADPQPKQLTFEYDSNEDLIKYTDSIGATQEFGYNNHNIISRKSQEGHYYYQNEYDEQRRVIKQTTGEGFVQTYQYNSNPDGSSATIVTDINGNTLTYNFSPDGMMTSNIDALGNATTYEYDSKYRAIREVDGQGNAYNYGYDDNNNQTKVVDPLGNSITREFNAQNQVIKEIDQEGNVTTLEYDDQYRLIKYTNKLGDSKTFSYNDFGQLISQTNFNGATYSYEYNQSGLLTKEIDPAGNTTTYNYDSFGNVITSTSPRGQQTDYIYDRNNNLIEVKAPLGYTIRNEYDKNNRLIKSIDANGGETLLEYDKSENISKITNPLGFTTTYQYGSMNQLLSVTDPEGRVTKMDYDKEYKETSVTSAAGVIDSTTQFSYNKAKVKTGQTDPLGRVTTYQLDNLNRLIAITEDQTGLAGTSKFTYDPTGGKTSTTDANGNITTFELDAMDRVVKETDSVGNIQSYSYDKEGNLISKTDPKGQVTTYEYNNLSQLIKTTNPEGGENTFAYDENGNLITQTDTKGKVTKFVYDELDRQIEIIDNYKDNLNPSSDTNLTSKNQYDLHGNLIQTINPRGEATKLEYDKAHRRTAIIDANGNKTSLSYDKVNNLISTTDRNGNTTSNSFDELNRLVATINAEGQETKYSYDKFGNLISTTDAKGGVTAYQYDGLNRLVTETDPMGGVQSFSYDNLSQPANMATKPNPFEKSTNANLQSYTNQNGAVYSYQYDNIYRLIADTDPQGYISKYSYDQNSNLIATLDRNGNATKMDYDKLDRMVLTTDAQDGKTSYTYDSEGNLIATVDANGNTTTYEFDSVYRQIKVTDGEGYSTSFEYDNNGNVLKQIDANGNATTYSFDKLDRQITVTNALGQTTTLGYDNEGNITSSTAPDNIVTKYDYDKIYNLIKVTQNYLEGNQKDNQTNVATIYSYDKLNNLSTITDPNGNQSQFTYDPLSRQIQETDAEGNTWRFNYDKVGNRTLRVDANGQVTNYQYFPDNQLQSLTYSTPAPTTQVNGVDGQKSSATNGFSVSYQYDPNNNRTSVIDNLGTTTYSFDNLNRLTAVNDALGQNQTYSYDKVGNRTAFTYPDGSTQSYEYLKNNWLKSITDPRGQKTTYNKDKVGNTTKVIYPNTTTSSTVYDRVNRVLQINNKGDDGSINSSFQYHYDIAGQRVKVEASYAWKQPRDITTTYNYDPIRRLTESKDSTGVYNQYSYDAVGNRLSYLTNDQQSKPISRSNTNAKNDEIKQTYTYNNINQVLNVIEETKFSVGAIPQSPDSKTNGNSNGNGNNGNGNGKNNVTPLSSSVAVNFNSPSPSLNNNQPQRINYVQLNNGKGNGNNKNSSSSSVASMPSSTSSSSSQSSTSSKSNNGNGKGNNQSSSSSSSVGAIPQSPDSSNNNGNNKKPDLDLESPAQSLHALLHQLNAQKGKGIDTETADQLISQTLSLIELLESGNQKEIDNINQKLTELKTNIEQAGQDGKIKNQGLTNALLAKLKLSSEYLGEDKVGKQNLKSINFFYDNNGNRIEKQFPGGSKNEGTSPSIGPKFQTEFYTYDYENNLTSSTQSQAKGGGKSVVAGNTCHPAITDCNLNTKTTSNMSYDAMNRRLVRGYSNSGNKIDVSIYTYDDKDPINIKETKNNKTLQLHRGENQTILSQYSTQNNQSTYYHHDALGSTVGISKDQGQADKNYRYGDFGGVEEAPGNIAGNNNNNSPFPNFTYTGQEYDSAFNLYEFYSRSYDPSTGSWLQQDKYRGEPVNPLSLHRYQYVTNSPINNRDYYGYWLNNVTDWVNDRVEDTKDFYKENKETIDAVASTTISIGVGVAVVAGCAAAGVATAGAAAIACAVGAGALAGAAGQATSNGLGGRDLNEGVLEAAVIGGVAGGLTAGVGGSLASSGVLTGKTMAGTVARHSLAYGTIGGATSGGSKIAFNLTDGDPCTTWDSGVVEAIAIGGTIGSVSGGYAGYKNYASQGVIKTNARPQIKIDRSKYPETAKHVTDAQNAGYPQTLTVDRVGAKIRRGESLKGIEKVPNQQLDEYPPAMFIEGGAGSSVRPISPSDNMGAGASMGNQLRQYPDGTVIDLIVD